MATIQINGMEYQLARNLRVAYMLQNQHNHEAYSTLLAKIGDMPIEQQIDFLYIAFQVANPDEAKLISKDMFRICILDDNTFNVSKLMELVMDIISGILGKDINADDADGVDENPDEDMASKN